jgi:hypothetical protein
MTLLIGSERNPVILVDQLHKEVVYERTDGGILEKKWRILGGADFFFRDSFNIVLLFIALTNFREYGACCTVMIVVCSQLYRNWGLRISVHRDENFAILSDKFDEDYTYFNNCV